MKEMKRKHNDPSAEPPAKETDGLANIPLPADAGKLSPNDKLVDNAYVISRWPITARGLQRLRSKGYLSYVRIANGRVMYSLKDVEDLLNKYYKKAIR